MTLKTKKTGKNHKLCFSQTECPHLGARQSMNQKQGGELIKCNCSARGGQDHNSTCETNRCCDNGFFYQDHKCLKQQGGECRLNCECKHQHAEPWHYCSLCAKHLKEDIVPQECKTDELCNCSENLPKSHLKVDSCSPKEPVKWEKEFDKFYEDWQINYYGDPEAFDMDLRKEVVKTELKEFIIKALSQQKKEVLGGLRKNLKKAKKCNKEYADVNPQFYNGYLLGLDKAISQLEENSSQDIKE